MQVVFLNRTETLSIAIFPAYSKKQNIKHLEHLESNMIFWIFLSYLAFPPKELRGDWHPPSCRCIQAVRSLSHRKDSAREPPAAEGIFRAEQTVWCKIGINLIFSQVTQKYCCGWVKKQ